MILISTHIEFDILHMRSVIDFVRLFILRLVFFFVFIYLVLLKFILFYQVVRNFGKTRMDYFGILFIIHFYLCLFLL